MALFTGHTITPDSALGGTQIQRSLRFAGAAYNSISRTPSTQEIKKFGHGVVGLKGQSWGLVVTIIF